MKGSEDIPVPTHRTSLWGVLRSLKLTLCLLILIAVTSVVGSLIPQNLSSPLYGEIYGPFWGRILTSLGLTDIYHGWWLIGLLSLLSVNLFLCSLNRLSKTWKLVKGQMRPLTEGRWSSLSIHGRFTSSAPSRELAERLKRELTKRGWSLKLDEKGADLFIMAQRGRWGRVGYLVTHLGVMVILIGALLGFLFGFEAMIQLDEGQTTDEVVVKGSERRLPLGFSVKCEDFSVLTYPDGTPKQYKSVLVFNDGSDGGKKATLAVNNPVRFGGYVFYQHSYGTAARVAFEVGNQKGHKRIIWSELGQTISLDEQGNWRIRPIRYVPQVHGKGSAILVVFFQPKGHPVGGWLLEGQGGIRFYQWEIGLREVKAREWTGLYVKKDPGVIPVFIGSSLIILGCIIAFLVPHRRLWARLRRDSAGETEALMAMASSKYPQAAKDMMERIWQRSNRGTASSAEKGGGP